MIASRIALRCTRQYSLSQVSLKYQIPVRRFFAADVEKAAKTVKKDDPREKAAEYKAEQKKKAADGTKTTTEKIVEEIKNAPKEAEKTIAAGVEKLSDQGSSLKRDGAVSLASEKSPVSEKHQQHSTIHKGGYQKNSKVINYSDPFFNPNQ